MPSVNQRQGKPVVRNVNLAFVQSRASTTSYSSQIMAFVLLSVAMGCGGGPQKDANRSLVSGVITLNGKPLPAGNLTFKAKDSPLATQTSIKADGRYSTDRVPLGLNLVSVETESLKYGSPSLYTEIPLKYTEYATSGLQVEVKAGDNANVNFDLN